MLQLEILNYPTREEELIRERGTVACLGAQTIIKLNPNTPYPKIIKAITPNQVSPDLRENLSPFWLKKITRSYQK